jgi:hypothetical protein
MKEAMTTRAILALLLAAAPFSHGQAVPAGDSPMVSTLGPNLPNFDGVLHYALSASEIIQLGYYGSGDVTNSTTFSGDVSYNGKSTVRPFSMLFAGGVILPNQTGQGTESFWNIAASQGYVTRHWVFNVSDSFSYLPQSPTTGLSGIPGVGDLGTIPIVGPGEGPAGGVLTTSGDRISNVVSGSVERQITQNTSVSGGASYAVLNFLGDNTDALNDQQISGQVALNHRIDARSSASLSAVYSTFSFSGPAAGADYPNIETRGLNVSYQRVLTRTLSIGGSIGPQWISSSNSLLVPSTLNIAASASLSYARRSVSGGIVYSHGVNGGSGVLPGGESDIVSGSLGRNFGRDWAASISAAYSHTTGLTLLTVDNAGVPVHETYDTIYGGGQVTRRISTHFSAYASYTAQHQSTSTAIYAPNAFIGTSQTFGIGITFTPRSTNLGQF